MNELDNETTSTETTFTSKPDECVGFPQEGAINEAAPESQKTQLREELDNFVFPPLTTVATIQVKNHSRRRTAPLPFPDDIDERISAYELEYVSPPLEVLRSIHVKFKYDGELQPIPFPDDE